MGESGSFQMLLLGVYIKIKEKSTVHIWNPFSETND